MFPDDANKHSNGKPTQKEVVNNRDEMEIPFLLEKEKEFEEWRKS